MKKVKSLGILGGGQLAKMLCDSAKKMGYETVIFDPTVDACGRYSANHHIKNSYGKKEALIELIEKTDVITYEFENVPSETIDILKKNRGNIPQGKKPLYISQHRVREKTFVKNLGVKTAKFIKVDSEIDLKVGIKQIELPAILKTCSGGYDGKGQWILRDEKDLQEIKLENKEYILEQMINFKLEVSCVVVRGIKGDIIVFPVGENIHKKGILHMTIVPARIEKKLEKQIQELAKKIIKGLDFVGPLGIEFFIGQEDDIYFNEMAPRPHNSAHYTMDACNFSQFDMHIKSLVGEKLEEPKLLSNVVMLNILGEDKKKLELFKNRENEDIKIHIYGKNSWKIGRKMGHINFLGKNVNELLEKIKDF